MPVVPRMEMPAEDAEARVPGLARELLAAGDRDRRSSTSPRPPCARRHLGDGRAHHLARDGIDRGLAGRKRQARLGHGAHTLARAEGDPAPGRPRAHGREDECAMGDVGIVAGVLDDAGAREALAQLLAREREGGPLALGQGDRRPDRGRRRSAAPYRRPWSRRRRRRPWSSPGARCAPFRAAMLRL